MRIEVKYIKSDNEELQACGNRLFTKSQVEEICKI